MIENSFYNIAFNSVLNDLLKWADQKDKEIFGRKVLRVYGLCLRQKHFELASRICKKYNSYFMQAPKYDLAMAMRMALMSQNKQEGGE